MELPQSAADARLRLQQLRDNVLTLHKAVLDSERTAYEIVHGPIASPASFLQLLINDPWFAWLQPLTTLIVQMDETLAAKKPPATEVDLERMIQDTHALLSPSRNAADFWGRYFATVQRDPAVAVIHSQVQQLFDAR
ncbi:MAG: hypothetical protein JO061_10700 [Acidobacteriaceae bacterium]|nr:hypothetical protein [Acidobacteriaceae bacterium]